MIFILGIFKKIFSNGNVSNYHINQTSDGNLMCYINFWIISFWTTSSLPYGSDVRLADISLFFSQLTKIFRKWFLKMKKLFKTKWRLFHNSQKVWLAQRLLKPNLIDQAWNKCNIVTQIDLVPTYLTFDINPRQTAKIGL